MSIESVGTKSTISPVQTQANRAFEKTQPLNSLQGRDVNTEPPTGNRSSKPNWISRLFQGGSPSLSGRKTAKAGGSKETQQTKTLEERKGSAQADKNTRSRFPRMRRAYQSFKNLFKGLRLGSHKAKTENKTTVRNQQQQQEAASVEKQKEPTKLIVRRNPELISKRAKLEENFSKIHERASQKRLALKQEFVRIGEPQADTPEIKQRETEITKEIDGISRGIVRLGVAYRAIKNTPGDAIHEKNRVDFNGYVDFLSRATHEDLSEFRLPK